MDSIEYRCPLHGTVVIRDGVNFQVTEDLVTCVIEGQLGQVCGRILTIEFVRHDEDTRIPN